MPLLHLTNLLLWAEVPLSLRCCAKTFTLLPNPNSDLPVYRSNCKLFLNLLKEIIICQNLDKSDDIVLFFILFNSVDIHRQWNYSFHLYDNAVYGVNIETANLRG